MVDQLYQHESGYLFIWECIQNTPSTLLHEPDSTFDLGNVFTCHSHVDGDEWHKIKEAFKYLFFIRAVPTWKPPLAYSYMMRLIPGARFFAV